MTVTEIPDVMDVADLDFLALKAVVEHAEATGLKTEVGDDVSISFGVGDLACKVQFVKGAENTAQLEFTVWIDAERKQAYIDQVSFYGNNVIEAISGAAHNWCNGQLPVWRALFQGKGTEGLLTHVGLTSFDDATMQAYKWDLYVGIGQSLGECKSVLERIKATPPYELIVPELMQLQMGGYFRDRPGVHCIKMWCGRGANGASMHECAIDGEPWEAAGKLMKQHQYAAERHGFYWAKQFILMVPPAKEGEAPYLAPQSSETMITYPSPKYWSPKTGFLQPPDEGETVDGSEIKLIVHDEPGSEAQRTKAGSKTALVIVGVLVGLLVLSSFGLVIIALCMQLMNK